MNLNYNMIRNSDRCRQKRLLSDSDICPKSLIQLSDRCRFRTDVAQSNRVTINNHGRFQAIFCRSGPKWSFLRYTLVTFLNSVKILFRERPSCHDHGRFEAKFCTSRNGRHWSLAPPPPNIVGNREARITSTFG